MPIPMPIAIPIPEVLAFLAIFFAMLVRTMTGFGSALISIPLLSLIFGAKFAIPFILTYECLIDVMILLRDRFAARSELRRASPVLVGGLIGVLLGTEVLILSSERLLRIIIGISLIVFSLLLLWNVRLKIDGGRTGSALAGLLGGFLCGSVGLPGPPMALILSSQGLAKQAFRRSIVLFLTIIDFTTLFYFTLVGLFTFDMLLQGLRLMPALILGFLLGDFAFAGCNEIRFRKIVMVIIIMAGMLSISSGISM
jgi:uncharacterized membrane protein YfcA